MKVSHTQVMTIMAMLATCIAFGVYATLFIIIKNKNNQISILQNKVDIEVRKDQRLHSTKQLTSDLSEEFVQVDKHFVSADGVVGFLEDLENLGRKSGASVSVNSVSVNENAGNGLPYEPLQIEFAARGSWKSVLHLISLLETFPLGITVSRMHLEKNLNSWQLNTSFSVLKLK